jgi:primosomal protein N' (replication factor Y)
VIAVKEQLIEKYKPKYERVIRLHPEFESDEKLKELFEELEKKATKQLDLLMTYLHLSHQLGAGYREISKNDLLDKAKSGNASLSALLKKNILIEQRREIGRMALDETKEMVFDLTPHQQEALQLITKQFEDKSVVLLHGVTSSGKTNVYIRLIEAALAKDQQVLYLLPEIALTAQIVERLRRQFGNGSASIIHDLITRKE